MPSGSVGREGLYQRKGSFGRRALSGHDEEKGRQPGLNALNQAGDHGKRGKRIREWIPEGQKALEDLQMLLPLQYLENQSVVR